jgi:hypothetical protein
MAMGKKKADATHEEVCRALIEVLRTADSEGIPLKRLNDVSFLRPQPTVPID